MAKVKKAKKIVKQGTKAKVSKGTKHVSKKGTKVKLKPKAEQKKRVTLSLMIPKADLSPKALKAISKADSFEVAIADAQDGLVEALKGILKELPPKSHTIEHPERGPMSILIRGEKVFWRGKPVGKQKAA